MAKFEAWPCIEKWPCIIELSSGNKFSGRLDEIFPTKSKFNRYAKMKESGNPYPVNVIVKTPEEIPGKNSDIIKANMQYSFNALETEIEARKVQKTDTAINCIFRGYNLVDLIEAREMERTFKRAEAYCSRCLKALKHCYSTGEAPEPARE